MNKKAEVLEAKVKGTDRRVSVYKLKVGNPTPDHIWNIYLGDNISISEVNAGKHKETFTSNQLEFITQ